MKKIILFLTISFICLISSATIVNAATDSFYEAEYIDDIYMVRYDKNTNTKYYQKARVYRRVSDSKLAYCLQPFKTFNTSDNIYETVGEYSNISSDTLSRIKDIISFGYGYKNHTDLKWYAITQLMIWQEVEPDSEFYFTDTLNGNKIEPYNSEIEEINNLIDESYIMPSFNNQTYYGVLGKTISLNDDNNVFANYRIIGNINLNVENMGNNLNVSTTTERCYELPFIRYYNINDPVLFYYNANSQHLATVGGADNKEGSVTFCFNELTLKIKKIDEDTGTTTSRGEASLKDTVFTLYNSNMEKIVDITLDDNMEAELSSNDISLDYGIYYLKETTSGTGYMPNDTIYEVNFTVDNTDISLTIENKVIEKEVTIKKYYGNGLLMENEAGISFEIYDINNNLVDTITTDVNGTAKITLPYGHYKVVQVNSTEGYTMIDDFEIFIEDINKDYFYTINDYEIIEENENEEEITSSEIISIEVPNTSCDDNNYLLFSIILPTLFIAKKKFS